MSLSYEEPDVLDTWYQEVGPDYDYYAYDEDDEEQRVEELMQVDRDLDPEAYTMDEELEWREDEEDEEIVLEPRELRPSHNGWGNPMANVPTRQSWPSSRQAASPFTRQSLPQANGSTGLLPQIAGKPPPDSGGARGAANELHFCDKCGKTFPRKLRLRLHWCHGSPANGNSMQLVSNSLEVLSSMYGDGKAQGGRSREWDGSQREFASTGGQGTRKVGHHVLEKLPPVVPRAAWVDPELPQKDPHDEDDEWKLAMKTQPPIKKTRAQLEMEAKEAEEVRQAQLEEQAEAAVQARLAQERHWSELEYERQAAIKRRHVAAARIQATWHMSHVRAAYLGKRSAVVTIQRAVRKSPKLYLAHKVAALRFQQAVLVCQATRRMGLARRELDRTRKAAIVIQRAARTWPFRKAFLRHRAVLHLMQSRAKSRFARRRAAAITIQRFVRRRWRHMRLRGLATTLQARARGALWRRRFLLLARRRAAAAACIQAAWLGSRQQDAYLQMRAAATTIQKEWRRHLAERRLSALRRAAVVCGRHARGALARRLFLRKVHAVGLLQAATRGMLGRRKAAHMRAARWDNENVYGPAALEIQRRVRGFLARRLRSRLEQARWSGACTVQRYWRGAAARAKNRKWMYVARRRRAAAAVTIQKYVKRWIAERRHLRWKIRRFKAARCIQRHLRGYLARRQVARMWEAEMVTWANRAATTIQRYVRGRAVRARFRGFGMERERKKRAEREAIKASVHKHRDAAVEQHLRDELQALVGLGGEDISRRGEAAEALARAVEKKEDAEARDRVAGMGAVNPLLGILREAVNGSPDDPDENTAAEFAALAVCRLARSKNLRSDIGYSDGVTPLMGLLAVHEEHGARPPALLKNVLLALVNLATLEVNRAKIRSLRGVALLAPHLKLKGRNHKVEGDSVQELSVRLLATLCNCKDREAEDARDQALESGLLPYLVDVIGLGVGHPSTSFALQALVKLLESSIENKEVWYNAGGILALVKLIEKSASCGDTVLAGRAVMALLNASSNSRTNKQAIVMEDGVDLVIWILQELVGDTESVAVRDPLLASDVVLLLRNLATEGPESQANVVEAGIVPLLLRLIRRAAAVASDEFVAGEVIDPKAKEAHQRVVRSGLNALNSVFSNEAARSEATDLKAALHLIAVLRAAQEREDKHSIKFALQAIAQLAAHNEEDWFLVKEHGVMTLLERTLGRPIDKPPGGRGNWWNRGNNASKNQHVGVPVDVRRTRGERIHLRLVKAKDKAQREASKWKVEMEANSRKAEAEAEHVARREAEKKRKVEELAERKQQEEEARARAAETQLFQAIREEAQQRFLAREEKELKKQRKAEKRQDRDIRRQKEEEDVLRRRAMAEAQAKREAEDRRRRRANLQAKHQAVARERTRRRAERAHRRANATCDIFLIVVKKPFGQEHVYVEIVTPEGLEDTIDGLDPEMYQAAFADVSMPNIKEGGPWNEPLPSERPASASSTDSEEPQVPQAANVHRPDPLTSSYWDAAAPAKEPSPLSPPSYFKPPTPLNTNFDSYAYSPFSPGFTESPGSVRDRSHSHHSPSAGSPSPGVAAEGSRRGRASSTYSHDASTDPASPSPSTFNQQRERKPSTYSYAPAAGSESRWREDLNTQEPPKQPSTPRSRRPSGPSATSPTAGPRASFASSGDPPRRPSFQNGDPPRRPSFQNARHWSEEGGRADAAREEGGYVPRPPTASKDDTGESHVCPRCGHKFKHRIRLQLHWCAGLDPEEAERERAKEGENQRRHLNNEVEEKKRIENERKQLWANLLQVAEEEEERRKVGSASSEPMTELSEQDASDLRDIILNLVDEMTAGLDKAGVLRAFRIPVTGMSNSELKLAYRRAAIRYHPDKNRNAGPRTRIFAEEAFKTISKL